MNEPKFSLQQAKEQVAEKKMYNGWPHLVRASNDFEIIEALEEAAELYRLESNKETWSRACEAQRILCVNAAYYGYGSNAISDTPNAPFKP